MTDVAHRHTHSREQALKQAQATVCAHVALTAQQHTHTASRITINVNQAYVYRPSGRRYVVTQVSLIPM